MRKIIGWALLIVVIFMPAEIDWSKLDNIIIWGILFVSGAIMTGGNK